MAAADCVYLHVVGENRLKEESLRTTAGKSPASACSLGFQTVFAAQGALPTEFLSK